MWEVHLYNPSAPTDVDSISETVEAVLDFIIEKGAVNLNLLDLIDRPLSGEHLAALLRTTYQWRDDVPGWNEMIEIAKVILIEQGVDPEDALYGLV